MGLRSRLSWDSGAGRLRDSGAGYCGTQEKAALVLLLSYCSLPSPCKVPEGMWDLSGLVGSEDSLEESCRELVETGAGEGLHWNFLKI